MIGALILVHGLIPEEFLVDSTTVGLLVLLAAVLAIPYFPSIRQYISELNVLGTGVKFREEVDTAAEEAEAIAAKIRQDGQHPQPGEADRSLEKEPPWPVFVEIGEHLYRLIEENPRLAIVGLGIEVERAVKELVRGMKLTDDKKPLSLQKAVSLLRASHRIDAEEEGLLARLIRLRTWALHGADLNKEDAHTFFSTVESLNDFSLGYSLNLSPNDNWQEQGLTCRYEHCIERMPLRRERWPGSCPVFGHNCPGGISQVDKCMSEEEASRIHVNLVSRMSGDT